jgi:hypothetical protein
MSKEVPANFSGESFSGFYITDEEVGPGRYRAIAIEVKHLFESLLVDHHKENQEFFLAPDFETALHAFVRRPSNFTLSVLLSTSPNLIEPITEITRLVSPSLVSELPVVI